MRKKRKYGVNKALQPYDTSLKGWVKNQPAKILPQLLPGAEYIGDLDVERIKPAMRVDRVFKIMYYGEPHVFHVEFESGADTKMSLRMLVYNGLLSYEYELPVISMIVYPFRVTMAVSPVDIRSGGKELHKLHFLTLPLFSLEAEQYIEKHIACMYPLLPTMEGANAAIIEQAMVELSELYREDETTLAQEFAWMQVLLERTTVISDEEKALIGEKLKMYDPLWEEHPRVRKIKAEAAQVKAEARAEARAAVEAEIEAANIKLKALQAQLQKAMVQLVRARFPELTELAQQRTQQIESPDVLGFLLDQISIAADESEARVLLRVPAA